jgi:hypothetical protein
VAGAPGRELDASWLRQERSAVRRRSGPRRTNERQDLLLIVLAREARQRYDR